jgi:hypothetical protein
MCRRATLAGCALLAYSSQLEWVCSQLGLLSRTFMQETAQRLCGPATALCLETPTGPEPRFNRERSST